LAASCACAAAGRAIAPIAARVVKAIFFILFFLCLSDR
jgi:hypothetical protein